LKKKTALSFAGNCWGLDVKYDDPKPQPRTKEYYQSRPCSELVGAAAQMLDELFTEGCDENIETHKENS
jgi:hypothetical protein